MSSPHVFFVEGNIGTGKSTFLSMIEKVYPSLVQVIYEPLDLWLDFKDKEGKNILQYFYEDPKRFAYTFQNVAFISRVEKLGEVDLSKKYIFIERSIWSDKNVFAKNCYENGLMTDIEFQLYEKWFDYLSKKLNLKFTYSFIYLKASPEISFERMNARNRKEENKISLDYLTQISKKHDDWFENVENVDKKVIDASVNFREPEIFIEVMTKVWD
jgi:deoxyadenosine/deoxycytidine kinase